MKCKNSKARKRVRQYREKIIEMVRQIEDVWILEQILKCIINITK